MINRVSGIFRQLFTSLHIVLFGVVLMVCGPVSAVTELDFSSSPVITPAVNPDIPQSALWENVGQLNGTPIDVKATVLGKSSDVTISSDGDNAKFLLGSSDMDITVSYEFFISGTSTAITVIPKILFQDIDTDDWGRSCFFCSSEYLIKETVTVPQSSVASYSFGANSTLSASTSSGEIKFEATSDNSANVIAETSVSVSFYPASSITVTYTSGDTGNRGFLFDGNIDFVFSSPNTTVFDSTAPTTPAVDALATSSATPTLTGTAEAYTTVSIDVAGGSYEVVADALGNWSIHTADDVNFAPNLNGDNEVVVVSTDAAGNATSDNTNNELTIDTTAPSLNAIERLSPAAEYTNADSLLFMLTFSEPVSQLDLTDFVLSGNLAASATLLSVQSSDNQVYEMTVDVPAAGNGSVGLELALGNNIIDQVGNALDSVVPSTNESFIVDNAAPAAPVISSPADASLSIENQIVISGTAESSATLAVYDDGLVLCSALVDAGGAWSCSSPVLSDGAHSLTAIVTDAADNNSTPSTSITVLIDANAPVAPAITSPAEGAVVNSSTPQFSGTAELSVSVVVSSGTTTLCSASSDASGNWSCTSVVSLSEGAVSVSAAATDSSNRTGPSSALRSFIVNAQPPSAPLISSPVGGSTVGDSTPQVSGTADVGSVSVFAGGMSYCSISTDASGNWSCSGSTFLGDGDTLFTATVTDALGDTSTASSAVLVTVDTTAPTAASITSPADGAVLALSQLDMSGRAEANSDVSVYDGSTLLCSSSADAGGDWSCSSSANLAQGEHVLTAKATDGVGNESALSVAVTVSIDSLAPSAPLISSPADGARVVSSSLTISGTAEVDSSVSVSEVGSELCNALAQSDGSWSCSLVMGSAEGEHELAVNATDAGGNTSAATIITLTLDTTAPDRPLISSPLDGSITNNQQPVFTGTAEAQSSVRLEVPTGEGCDASADSSGNWSCTVSVALTDGDYAFTATASDEVGNVSLASVSVGVSIDTQNPGAPIITSPANNALLANAMPTVSGTAEVGSAVSVYAGASIVCNTMTDGAGSWACTTSSLADATYSFTATSSDTAGNISVASVAVSLSIDTTAPAAPAISSPTESEIVTDNTPSISGSAEANSTLTVSEAGSTLCLATADGAGNWSCASTITLAEGAHSLSAVAKDAAGNSGVASVLRTFIVDAFAPAAPVISSPLDGSLLIVTTPTLSGSGEAGSTVTVTENSNALCSAVVDAGGAWSCTSAALTDGIGYTLVATAKDLANNTSDPSTVVTITIDTTAPPAPVIAAPSSNAFLNNTLTNFSGTGISNDVVTVFEASASLCSATVDVSNNWECSKTLSEGAHTVTATAVDAATNTSSASDPVSFTVDLTAPAAPVIQSPSSGTETNVVQPAFSGSAEANSSVRVKNGATELCNSSADASGQWTCASTSALSEASHSLTAEATDQAGNGSVASAAITIVVDLTAPSAPSISSPANSSVMGDATPLIQGSAEAGGNVVVEAGGSQLCSAVASVAGEWSCTSSTLIEGEHLVSAKASDQAGNASASSAVTSFTVDLTAPDAPSISSPVDGGLLIDNTPSIEGTADLESQIEVYSGANLLCQASTTAGGTWACVSAELAEGNHNLSAIAKDAVGNGSAASTVVAVSVDAGPPPAPQIVSPGVDSLLNTNTPTFSGTAENDSTVEIKEGGATRCSALTDNAGSWSCVSAALGEGTHSLSAVATDIAGNIGPASSALVITIDSKVPDAPIFSSPANDTSFTANVLEITGVAEANAVVQVLESGNSRCATSPITADSSGSWTCTTTALAEGDHLFYAIATDGAGNVSVNSANLSFLIDTVLPSAPVVTSPAQGDTLTEERPTLSGTAEANISVEVSEGANLLCQATVNGSGNWACTTLSLTEGAHSLLVEAVDQAGNRSGLSLDLIIDTLVPAPAQITHPADGALISDTTPTVRGKSEAGTEVRVYANSIALCSALTDSNGDWACTSSALLDGEFTLVTVATAPTGESSAPSATATFVLDNTPPSPPLISSPKNGQLIGTNAPLISGSAEANSDVTVLVTHSGGTDLSACTATADGNGIWACTSTTLPAGSSQFTAFANDPALNTSPDSAPANVTLSADSDGDLLMDDWECTTSPCEDSDADGIADFLDVDSDNDGVPDKIESGAEGVDSDGDGIDDHFDVDNTGGVDANNDGIDDESIALDSDADGIFDLRDPDSDGDGIPDIYENQLIQNDTDGDGISDSFDVNQTGGTDADNDGIDDNVILPDSDSDGYPNYLDTDSNNDGVSDGVEGGASGIDSDVDGIDDNFDVDNTAGTDVNNDGVDDGLMPLDSDGDGTADSIDISNDEDADGVPDLLESRNDSDGDGIADFRDTDSDNDGIPDGIESGALGNDSDGDGISDIYDVDQTGGNDANADGIDDAAAPSDRDNDGKADYLDDDSDGDGISDLTEGADDSDHDGLANYRDSDSDNDGISDQAEGSATDVDSDGDGIANFLDLDSDNDGLPDAQEAGAGIEDINNDGRADNFQETSAPVDTDADGLPDYLDLDSNNDGFWDLPEQYAEFDQNSDGRIELEFGDANGDGVIDVVDLELYIFDLTRDSDGDGIPDYSDVDDDNDGAPDLIEGGLDLDGNGFPDSPADFDNDGVPDYLDIDSDNDGIADTVELGFIFLAQIESNVSDNGSLIQSKISTSADLRDSDGDGAPDYIDLDSDGDSLYDLHEIGRASLDTNGTGQIPVDNDGNQNGLNDELELGINGSTLRIVDSDDDAVPDYLDWDSDNDGFSDQQEAGADLNGNGKEDYLEGEVGLKSSLGGSLNMGFLLLLGLVFLLRNHQIIAAARLNQSIDK